MPKNKNSVIDENRRMKLAEAVRTARGSMTQDVLRQELEVSQATVSRWENGEDAPSLDTLSAIEDICGRPQGFIVRLAGYVADVPNVEDAIAADPHLDGARKELMVMSYRAAILQAREARRPTGSRRTRANG